jgi:myo-inositol 2-dehydrogenase/D-chiro-inositol 1-dehydrogenase
MSSVSRRNLVQAAALLPLQAIRGTAASDAVTVGVVGVGNRGSFDASTIAKDPRARVVAICDISDEQIAKTKEKLPSKDVKVYKDFHQLLASDVDAVIIATPVFLHPEHFEAAVKSGKHIYIEKPAGADVEGCKRVMRAADGADRKVNITFGFQQRYGPVYLNAKKMLDSGAIGKVREVHGQFLKSTFTGNEPPLPPLKSEADKLQNWKLWRSTFGDVIVETYCHNIDAINWFMGGHPGKAYGTGGRTVETRGDIMDHLNVTFDYADKVQATFIGSQMTPKFYRAVSERYLGANGIIETAREFWTYDLGKGPVTEKSAHDISIDSLEAFVTRVKEGKPENTGVRAAESTLTTILGRMAIEQRREVTWEEMMRS